MLESTPKQNASNPVFRTGQALVEFVLVLPLLIALLLGAYWVGDAMYTGANAASAMKEPVLNKLALADDNSGNTLQIAQSLIQNYQSGSFQISGNPVDSVSLQYAPNVSSILVGRKSVSAPISAIPSFNFTTAQAINANLFKNNTGASTPLAAAAPAGASINVSPADYGLDPNTLQSVALPLASPSCDMSVAPSINIGLINAYIPDPNSLYTITQFAAPSTLPVTPFNATYSAQTPVDGTNLYQIPNTDCDSTNWQSVCTTEGVASNAIPMCAQKKQASCRLEYASLYTNALITAYKNNGGCNGTMGTGADVTFSGTGQEPNY